MSAGRRLSITPTSSSAEMPRLASARLMERPADAGAAVFLGSRRRSRSITRCPRLARKIARSGPARPAPTSVISGVERGVLTGVLGDYTEPEAAFPFSLRERAGARDGADAFK